MGWNQSFLKRRRGYFSQVYLSWLVGLMLGVGPRAWACPG